MFFEFCGFSWGGAVAATAASTATVSVGTGTVALGTVAVGAGTALTAETIAIGAILGLSVAAVVGVDEIDNVFDSESAKDTDKDKNGKKEKRTPYDGKFLGEIPSVCPQEGFKWRGSGKPGSRGGGYFNDQTQESLRPDFHTEGHKKHWDYENCTHNGKARLYTDGTHEWKK